MYRRHMKIRGKVWKVEESKILFFEILSCSFSEKYFCKVISPPSDGT